MIDAVTTCYRCLLRTASSEPKSLNPSIVPLEYTGTNATHTMLTLEKKKAG